MDLEQLWIAPEITNQACVPRHLRRFVRCAMAKPKAETLGGQLKLALLIIGPKRKILQVIRLM